MNFIRKHQDFADELLIFVLILLVEIYGYLEDGVFTGEIESTIKFTAIALLVTLERSFIYFAYLTAMKKPVVTTVMLFLAQISIILAYVVNGFNYNNVLAEYQTILILLILVMIIRIYQADRTLYPDSVASVKSDSIFKRFGNDINYERKLYKVPVWATIICYCLILSLVGVVANSDTYKDTGLIKYFYSISTILPNMIIIGIASTSTLTYQLLVVQNCLDIITVYALHKTGTLENKEIVFMLCEIVVSVLIYYRYFIYNKCNSKKLKGAEVGD